MPINKNSLQAKINNLSIKIGVHQNILLKTFFFDAFLKRLSRSNYIDNFVFKGGFLLSTSLGINLRSTMDIDFLLRKMDLERDNIVSIMKEVSTIDVGDRVSFEYKGIEEIRQEDEYGGYCVTLIGKLENIKETINVDIATGDPITPSAIDYRYKCLFDDESLSFKAYNFETILAEKLQTILYRGIANSRSKDFYDLYIIHKLRWNDIDTKLLIEAFNNTCKYRETIFTKDESLKIIENIKKDPQMETRWNSYRKRNKFVGDIEFKESIDAAILIIEDIYRHQKYRFINNDVKIDFPLSKTMQDLVDKAEKADILNDYGLYMNIADAIDSQGKKETTHHLLKESEWKKLVKRYRLL